MSDEPLKCDKCGYQGHDAQFVPHRLPQIESGKDGQREVLTEVLYCVRCADKYRYTGSTEGFDCCDGCGVKLAPGAGAIRLKTLTQGGYHYPVHVRLCPECLASHEKTGGHVLKAGLILLIGIIVLVAVCVLTASP
jgi:hypothetical protein